MRVTECNGSSMPQRTPCKRLCSHTILFEVYLRPNLVFAASALNLVGILLERSFDHACASLMSRSNEGLVFLPTGGHITPTEMKFANICFDLINIRCRRLQGCHSHPLCPDASHICSRHGCVPFPATRASAVSIACLCDLWTPEVVGL